MIGWELRKFKLSIIIEVFMEKSCLILTNCSPVFPAEMFVTVLRSLMSSLSGVMTCPCSCQVTCLPLTSWSLANIGCGASLQQPDLEVGSLYVIDFSVILVKFTLHFHSIPSYKISSMVILCRTMYAKGMNIL